MSPTRGPAVRISSIDYNTLEPSTLVTFRLIAGVAVGKWEPHSRRFRVELERDGIVSLDGRRQRILFPSDGAEFLSALVRPPAFGNSTFIDVCELDADE